MIHGHGGNIFALAREMACRPDEIIDMSSNVNPLGPMPEMMAHLESCLGAIVSLPEPDAGSVVRSFARFHGLNPGKVIAASGTTQFIHILPRILGLRNALIPAPTYADYQDSCTVNGCRVTHMPTDAANDFQPDLSRLDATAGEYDAVFVCNPNNPTGILTPVSRLVPIINAHPDTYFVMDESYLPFVSGGQAHSFISLDLPNVIILSSMSKIFRIPGLRIGFMVAPKKIIQLFSACAAPWSVNVLADAAIDFLMGNAEQTSAFIARSQAYLARERETFLKYFGSTAGIHWHPSTTSFLLGELSPGIDAARVCRFFAQRKILIRNCENFAGLTKHHVRVSLKTTAINRQFCELFTQMLSNSNNIA